MDTLHRVMLHGPAVVALRADVAMRRRHGVETEEHHSAYSRQLSTVRAIGGGTLVLAHRIPMPAPAVAGKIQARATELRDPGRRRGATSGD